jgi:hypothetical protein
MAPGDIISDPTSLFLELGKIGLWIQAIGLVVIIWIIVQGVTLFFNRRRRKAIYAIKEDLERIEKKIDRIDKKLSKK